MIIIAYLLRGFLNFQSVFYCHSHQQLASAVMWRKNTLLLSKILNVAHDFMHTVKLSEGIIFYIDELLILESHTVNDTLSFSPGCKTCPAKVQLAASQSQTCLRPPPAWDGRGDLLASRMNDLMCLLIPAWPRRLNACFRWPNSRCKQISVS